MPEDRSRNTPSAGQGLAMLGAAVLAIGCCGGVPLVAAVATGGIAAGTLIGTGAGIAGAVLLVVVAVLVVRARRRRSCAPRAARGVPVAPKRR